MPIPLSKCEHYFVSPKTDEKEDLITFSSDEELKTALENFNEDVFHVYAKYK